MDESKLYDIHLKVPAKLLSTLVELMEQEQGVVIDIGSPVPTAQLGKSKRRKATRHRGENGLETGSASALCLHKLGGLGTFVEVSRIIKQFGFASRSASSGLSRAREAGLVNVPTVKGGSWSLTTKGEILAKKLEQALTNAKSVS